LFILLIFLAKSLKVLGTTLSGHKEIILISFMKILVYQQMQISLSI